MSKFREWLEDEETNQDYEIDMTIEENASLASLVIEMINHIAIIHKEAN